MRDFIGINEIHNILYDALCYLDSFCNEHSIKYFLSNGTLLGAAKYHDFIPWDDDVDVLMPRDDYDRLMTLTAINTDKYRLLCVEQISEWRMPYAKLSCEDTLVKEGDYNFGVSFGLSVDIFPIDNWSSFSYIAKLQAFESECLKRLLVCSIGGDFRTKKTGLKRHILKAIWKTGKHVGYEKLQRTLLKTSRKSNGRRRKYVGCRAWTCHVGREVFPSEYFEESVYLDFRDRKFPTLKKYEDYLSSLYGRWKEELPIEQQHSNHEIKVWYKDAK
jgi:lipopolysaccharide cholinephosphotransferase